MTRLNPFAVAPEQMKLLIDYAVASGEGFDARLKSLVKMRASQLNGCSRCLHMHVGEARKAGVSDEGIHMLAVWREASNYSDRERAALEWTEALTQLCHTFAPDAAYDGLAAHFAPAEIVQLTMLINAINSFNRVAVGFRLPMTDAAIAKAA